mgnify:CR=1 FL=1
MTARRLWIFLILSLCANLFLGGLFAGKLIFDRKPPPPGHRVRVDLRHAMRALEPASREKADQLFRLRRPEMRKRLRAVRSARRKLRRLLAADDATQAQIEAAFADVRRRGGEAQEAFQAVLREIALALPPDQRKAFFRAAFARRGRHHRR